MRRYDIIFGILLSIINFALAAPIPVQENHQTCVDVPRDVVIVLEKRGPGDELEKLAEYFEKLGDPHASPSLLPPGHEQSMSDAQASSSPQPGLEHEPMNDEHVSEPAPELLLEPSYLNPLSTEPSTYTPVSTVPSSYTSTEYGSDDELTDTHVSQSESYPHEWDYWLNPEDHADQEEHVYQPDSPQPQQNGFAHGHDVQSPLPQQNGFAHDQMDNEASSDPSSDAPTLTEHGSDDESMGTHTSQTDSLPPEYYWVHPPWDLGLEEVHVDQPNPPPPQENDMAHGTQVGDVQPSQENGAARETQVDDGQQPNPEPLM